MCIRDRWWSSVAPAIGVDRDFPPWRPTLAQASSDVVRLRAELAELRAQNAELRLTCQLLGERTEALRERNRLLSEEVTELRRRVDQNPRNSHRPPSSEGYAKPAPRPRRERTDRQPGGQPGHPGATLGQVATPAERVRHRPEVCAGCGAALAEASVVSTDASASAAPQ